MRKPGGVVSVRMAGFVGAALMLAQGCGGGGGDTADAGTTVPDAAPDVVQAPVCGDGRCATGEACGCPRDCGNDSDQDGVAEDAETFLADRFSPIFYFDSMEPNLPCGADWFLSRARLGVHYNNACPLDEVLPVGSVTHEALVSQMAQDKDATCTKNGPLWSSSDTDRYFKDDYFVLTFPEDGTQTAIYQGDVSGASWLSYVHVSKSVFLPGGFDVQYYLNYSYDTAALFGANASHEGDWEHITVTVEPNMMDINSIYYAGHNNEGSRSTLAQLTALGSIVNGTHPKAFVARGAHANFAAAGVKMRADPDRTDDDDIFDGLGRSFDTAGKIINVGDFGCWNPATKWMGFGGRWGNPTPGSAGTPPPSPSTHVLYWAPERMQ